MKETEETKAHKVRITSQGFLNESSDSEVTEDEDHDVTESGAEPPLKRVRRNYSGIPNVALAGLRFGVGLRLTAAIATAALIDSGRVTEEDTSNVIDKNKVKRAQDKLMTDMEQKFEAKLKSSDQCCRT